MSAYTFRRIILENASAVAQHCPVPGVRRLGRQLLHFTRNPDASFSGALSSVGQWCVHSFLSVESGTNSKASRRSFSLINVDEMKEKMKEEATATHQRLIVLSTRPSPSLIRGAGGVMCNSILGVLLTPILFLSLFLERVSMMKAPIDLATSVVFATMWSGCFALTAAYAALQQGFLSLWFGLFLRPLYYLLNASGGEKPLVLPRFWCGLTCRFEPFQSSPGDPHPELMLYPSEAQIWESAAQRKARAEKLAVERREGIKNRRGGEDEMAKSSSSGPSYYALLGISESATPAEIKAAYRRLALKVHPDRNPSAKAAEQFGQLQTAYETLSNPVSRKKYDVGGKNFAKDEEDGKNARKALRTLFGGDELQKLAGDVFFNSFYCRVIDKVDFTQEEMVVLQQLMEERSRNELYSNYLRGFSPSSDNTVWLEQVKRRVKKEIMPFGLGAEVLYLIGEEYGRVVKYFNAEFRRDSSLTSPLPFPFSHLACGAVRAQHYVEKDVHQLLISMYQRYTSLPPLVRRGEKSSMHSLDAAWYWASPVIRSTVRRAALGVLYAPNVPMEERQSRVRALEMLSSVFISCGKPYAKATKASVDRLQDSMLNARSAKKD